MSFFSASTLSHSFDYPLFENISFELNQGQTMSIQGTSGCGKSTLLHICSTLLEPKIGEVFFQEQSLYKLNEDDRLNIRRNDFGIIFQSHYLFKGFTALENIQLSEILVQNNDNTLDLANSLGISKVIEQKVGDLSGGQQQRVSIARVLAKKPKIIFADEPTGNLDKNNANEVMKVLFNYVSSNNAILILVTHDENIAKLCHTKYVLEDYKLLRQ